MTLNILTNTFTFYNFKHWETNNKKKILKKTMFIFIPPQKNTEFLMNFEDDGEDDYHHYSANSLFLLLIIFRCWIFNSFADHWNETTKERNEVKILDRFLPMLMIILICLSVCLCVCRISCKQDGWRLTGILQTLGTNETNTQKKFDDHLQDNKEEVEEKIFKCL